MEIVEEAMENDDSLPFRAPVDMLNLPVFGFVFSCLDGCFLYSYGEIGAVANPAILLVDLRLFV